MFVIPTFVRDTNILRGDPPAFLRRFWMRHFDAILNLAPGPRSTKSLRNWQASAGEIGVYNYSEVPA